MNYRTISFLLLSMALHCISFGQGISSEIEKLNAIYKHQNSLELELNYNFYSSHTAASPHEENNSIIKMQGKNIYSKIGAFEVIRTDEYEFRINHDEKAMMLLPSSPTAQDFSMAGFDTLAKAMLKTCSDTAITKVSDTENKITMSCSFSDYEKFEIFYNPNNYKTLKYALYYRYGMGEEGNKFRLEVEFVKQKKNVKFEDQLFSIAPFLQKDAQSNYSPTAQYKTYVFQDKR